MKERSPGSCFLSFIIIGFVILLCSCPAILTDEMMLNIRDVSGPRIVIASPGEDEACSSEVIVTGTATDISDEEGNEGSVQSISWEILSAGKSGAADFDETGAFSFTFETDGLPSKFVLKVTAEDWNGNSGEASLNLKLLEDNSIPSFSATPMNGKVLLQWEDVPFAESYDLYYTTTGTLPSESFGTFVPSITSPYELENLNNGNMCVFRLRANPQSGHRENWSGYEYAIPLSERTLSPIVAGGNRQINICWPTISATDEFEIWKSISGSSSFAKISASHRGNSFTDRDVIGSTHYYYKINPSFSDEIISAAVGGQADLFPAEPSLSGMAETQSSYVRKIAVSGDNAYMVSAISDYFIIADISDPSSPEIMSELNTGASGGVAASGQYAYVTGNADELKIINISDPSNPFIEKTVTTSANAGSVEIHNGYALVGVGANGFDIIDIDPADSASVVSTRATGGYNSEMSRWNNSLYVYNDNNHYLYVYDITNPLSIPTATAINIGINNIYDVAGYGDYACLITGSTLYVVNTDTSTVMGNIGNLDSAGGVAVNGKYAYVADYHEGLKMINFSDPSNPALIHGIDTSGSAWDVELSGDFAYVADGDGLASIEVLNPAAAEISHTEATSNAQKIAISENYAYIADYGGGLRIMDISTPGVSTLTETVSLSNARNVALSDDYVFVKYNDGTSIVDISDPGQPSVAGTISDSVSILAVYGGYAYGTGGAGFAVFDISDPTAPLMVKSVSVTEGIYDIAIEGDYAYVAANNPPDIGGSSHIWIIDISNPQSAKTIKKVATQSYVQGIAVSGNYAYAAEASYESATDVGFSVIDISSPSTASLIATLDITDSCYKVDISGSYAYLVEIDKGMIIIDIVDPFNPEIIATVDTSGFAQDVVVSGQYAYVADGSGGFAVIDLLP